MGYRYTYLTPELDIAKKVKQMDSITLDNIK